MRPPSVHLLLPREEVIGDLAAQGVHLFFLQLWSTDRDFDESLKMLSESRARCIKVADTYARIEEDLNEGLRVVRNHFRDTATATLALTSEKNDRGHNDWWTLFARQGYARRRLRGGRDGEVGGVMSKGLRESQGEMDWLFCVSCFGVMCCDRVSDIESKRFVSSSRLVWSRKDVQCKQCHVQLAWKRDREASRVFSFSERSPTSPSSFLV